MAAPLVAWIIAGLEGATVLRRVSAVGAGLMSIGMLEDSIVKYGAALRTDAGLKPKGGRYRPRAQLSAPIGTIDQLSRPAFSQHALSTCRRNAPCRLKRSKSALNNYQITQVIAALRISKITRRPKHIEPVPDDSSTLRNG